MYKNEIKTLKQQIEYVLEHHPLTRNDDGDLTLKIWELFYPDKVIQSPTGPYVFLDKIPHLPDKASVQRIRAMIQNYEKRFVPTDPAVAKGRGWQAEEWQKALGYTVDNKNQFSFSL